MASVELGDRYWAAGLPAAARAAYTRAADAATAATRLTELALAMGDATAARKSAALVPASAAAEILVGRAALAAGEVEAARRAFARVLDRPGVTALERAAAAQGLGRVAAATHDLAGQKAHARAAWAALGGHGGTGATALVLAAWDPVLEFADGLTRDLLAAIGADEAWAMLDEAPVRHDDVTRILTALLAAADPARIDQASAAWLALAPHARPGGAIALRVAHAPRPSAPDPGPDERVAAWLALAEADARPETLGDRATACTWLAQRQAASPGHEDRALALFQRALALRPGAAAVSYQLAMLLAQRGATEPALAELERALRLDAAQAAAWHGAARLLDGTSWEAARAVVGRLFRAADPTSGPGAAGLGPRLAAASAEMARAELLAGVSAHGHRVKNVLGVLGARARAARKLATDAAEPGAELVGRLRDLERDVLALYEEWGQYLRAMQTHKPTLERVATQALLDEVVATAAARGHVEVRLEVHGFLPDLHADRVLVREALQNLVNNAVDACAQRGDVVVRVQVLPVSREAGAPVIEIAIVDSGVGISRGELARVFSPGFTTKPTGSGVGLTTAERIIVAHHGAVQIDSEEGRGTTVTVRLPLETHSLRGLALARGDLRGDGGGASGAGKGGA